jgi:hypothetical protein
MPQSSRATLLSWLALLALVAGTAGLAWTLQRPITLNGGLGWDGVEYARVAEQLSHGGRPAAEAPFVYRVGAPALAAWLSPGDALHGFRLVNGAAALLAPLLLFAWLGRHGLRPGTRLLLAGLFATQWHAPLRLTPFYPVHADPLMWLFWLGGLLLLDHSRPAPAASAPALPPLLLAAWLAWAALALPCREVLLLPALALACRANPLLLRRAPLASWRAHTRARLRPALFAPALLGLALFLLIRAWAEPTNSYGFVKTAVLWLWLKSLPHYLHGMCQAFGPALLVLVALDGRRAWRRLAERQDLLALAAGVAALGWLGGGDTERLLYWGAPLLLLAAGQSLEQIRDACRGDGRRGRALAWLAFLALAQALGQRLAWLIPDHPGSEELAWPLLTPLSASGRYLDLWSQHARPEVAVLSLAQYLVVMGLGVWGGRCLLRGAAGRFPAAGQGPDRAG